jgi:tetratricopeptide (TPR) repeat protein
VLLSVWLSLAAAAAQPPQPIPPGAPADGAAEAKPDQPPPAVSADAPKEAGKDKGTPPPPDEKAEAESPTKKRLFERNPYDVIVLDKANDFAELPVRSLPFRKLPDKPARVGKFKVKLLEKPDEDYEVMWRHVERIDFFETLVLREAVRIAETAWQLGAGGKYQEARAQFDDAYDYFRFLLRSAPDTPGLEAALQSYLYANAGIQFLEKRIPEAFTILEEVYRRNPQYQHQGGTQTVQLALDRVGSQLVKSYVDRQNYPAARLLLERLQRDYGERLKMIAEWRQQLSAVAAKKRDEAAAHLAAGRLREAHETSREMLKVWPKVEGGRALLIEIARQYPLIVVGVGQPALQPDPESLDNPASRRAGNLVYHTLLHYLQRGPEGGRYGSPFGTVQISDDRRQLVFTVSPTASLLSGPDVARELLALADSASPAYRPAWGSLVAAVQVQDFQQVVVDLRRPHVLPQALLAARLAAPRQPQRYTVEARAADTVRYAPVGTRAVPGTVKPVIVEKHFPEPHKAIEALRKGAVDLLDRVLPGDALRLQADQTFVVGRYTSPSVHVLVPNSKHPFLANRTFRRALLYGINREVILERGLLGKKQLSQPTPKDLVGCRLISAPVPAGVVENDPAAYAYDDKLEVRAYDPVMAIVLVRLAQRQLDAVAEKRQEPPPELKPLVLAHPATEVARFVAKQIQAQLQIVELECQLRELPPGATIDPEQRYDLLYQELLMTEPLTDLPRLFGTGGLCPASDPYVNLAIRRLENAENWKEARERLREVHRLLYEDVTVVPLWQMIDHFVYRRGLSGAADRLVHLYQDVEQWRVLPVEAND